MGTTTYEGVQERLRIRPRTWLVTGVAGFIGSHLLETLHLNADSRILHGLVLKVDALQPHSLFMMSLVSMVYAALLLTEGVGLWFEFSWAAYLTVISTSLLLPFELYEVIERITAVRIGVLLLNLVIVLYLVYQLKHRALHSRHHT